MSDGYGYDAGGDAKVGKYLENPGTYHLEVLDIEFNARDRDGNLRENAAFEVTMCVLGGTDESQIEKTTRQIFWRPKSADKGDFNTKVIDRFAIATNCCTIEDVEKRNRIDINEDKVKGMQIVAKFVKSDDDKYIQFNFADIYHVDDMGVKDVPKNLLRIGEIPPKFRWVDNKPRTGETKPAPMAAADYDAL